MAKPQHAPSDPMTLGNMRILGDAEAQTYSYHVI
jgi:hypothetical protein